MVSSIDLAMSLDYMYTKIQIGPTIFLMGRALMDIISVLAPVWSRGAAESSRVWHSVRLKLSMWQHVQRAKKQYGFGSRCLGYLVSDWWQPAFGVTTRVA
jgi:hypothetical protein